MTITTAYKPGSFAVLSSQLDSFADTINSELSEMNRLFKDEFIPRCQTIGDTLAKAKGNTTNTAAFYEWAESKCGIKERQVRTYLRFAHQLPAIQAVADSQTVELTSMEQGLQLLAPTKVSDFDSSGMTTMVSAVGRAKGAISRAMETMFDIVTVDGIDPRHREALELAQFVLNQWAESSLTDQGELLLPSAATASAVDCQPEWQDTPTEVEPVAVIIDDAPTPPQGPPLWAKDRQRLIDNGLPIDLKPGKWTLAQLEQGLALCDDTQSRVAAAINVTRAAMSSCLRRKRAPVTPTAAVAA